MPSETNIYSKSDAESGAMRYLLVMLLQRLEGAGQIDLAEIMAVVEAGERASPGASLLVQETFLETLKLLKFARNRG